VGLVVVAVSSPPSSSLWKCGTRVWCGFQSSVGRTTIFGQDSAIGPTERHFHSELGILPISVRMLSLALHKTKMCVSRNPRRTNTFTDCRAEPKKSQVSLFFPRPRYSRGNLERRSFQDLGFVVWRTADRQSSRPLDDCHLQFSSLFVEIFAGNIILGHLVSANFPFISLPCAFDASHHVSLERISFLDQLLDTLRVRAFGAGQSLQIS
jgi:hypothetical protein